MNTSFIVTLITSLPDGQPTSRPSVANPYLLTSRCEIEIGDTDVLTEEPTSCVKVEVAVPGSPSLTVLMVSVDVKQQ